MCKIKNCKNQKKLKVVVIDSGIDKSICDLHSVVISDIGFTISKDGLISRAMNMPPSHSHGTGVALIIKHIFLEIEIISINILDSLLISDGRLLIHAIKEAINFNPDIIHMSLGTTSVRYKFKLKRLVKKSFTNHIIIVTAMNNQNKKSYPSNIKM